MRACGITPSLGSLQTLVTYTGPRGVKPAYDADIAGTEFSWPCTAIARPKHDFPENYLNGEVQGWQSRENASVVGPFGMSRLSSTLTMCLEETQQHCNYS